MRKHLAIVCGVYYPEPSPTGLCAKRFAELLADKFDIDIICISMDGKDTCAQESFVEKSDVEIKIYAVGCKRIEIEKKAHGAIRKVIHNIGGIQIKTFILGNLSWYRKKALRKLEKINTERKLDIVFTICSPMAAHFAGADMKKRHPEIKHCGYTVDPYSSRERIRPFYLNYAQLVKYEKKVFSQMDGIFLSEEIIVNRPDLLNGLSNYSDLPYMLPEPEINSTTEKFYQTSGINCVYAGRFYEDIRNPEYMLQLFSRLEKHNINLHLFCIGCEDIVKKYDSQFSNIIVHKSVSHEMMGAVYDQADVLVGIGNTTSEFFPSKTFEYIATKKPIVFINHNDMKNDILEHYPIAIQVSDSDDINVAIQRLEKFCIKSMEKSVSMDEIKRIYYKHTKENITMVLKEML